MTIARGMTLLTAALLATSLLAACGEDEGADAAPASTASANPLAAAKDVDGKAVPLSLQVRAVRTVRDATDDECKDEPPVRYAAERPMERACSLDETLVYSLGPAALTEGDVRKVELVDSGAPNGGAAEVTLDRDGARTFKALTRKASKQPSPRNMFAILVDGRVASSPEVANGAITGGTFEVSMGDPTWTTTFVDRWAADQQ